MNFIAVLILLFSSLAHGKYEISSIIPATSVEASKKNFDARKLMVLRKVAEEPLGKFGENNGIDFCDRSIARLELFRLGHLSDQSKIDEINREILAPTAVPFAQPGTNCSYLGPALSINGNYDFTVIGLVRLISLYGSDTHLILPETREKILEDLLSIYGSQPVTQVHFGVLPIAPETENHILMTESSRYLTNQLLLSETFQNRYNNDTNGMSTWMKRYLKNIIRHYFSEYNSHPYEAFSELALQNLADFSINLEVKTLATALLDFQAAKFATSSNSLRQAVPFRRQKKFAHKTDVFSHSAASQRMFILAGNSQALLRHEENFFELNSSSSLPQPIKFIPSRMISPSVGSYRVPDVVTDLIVNHDHPTGFQKYSHTGVEIYYGSKNYLISAGGIWINKFDFGTRENSGWALPTTIMPTLGGMDYSEFIRIDGHPDDTKRINTCVARNFACGIRPVIPEKIRKLCSQQVEDFPNWTFVDFTSEKCPFKFELFVALYKGPNQMGIIETAEPREVGSFETFRNSVLQKNGSTHFSLDSKHKYITSDQTQIEFRFIPEATWDWKILNWSRKWNWGILSINGVKQETRIRKWKLAEGDIIDADRTGNIYIKNPYLKKAIHIDVTQIEDVVHEEVELK